MHVFWDNCPIEIQGEMTGVKGQPTMIIESVSGYKLYFWHENFGYPGLLNDNTIWERSTIHIILTTGEW